MRPTKLIPLLTSMMKYGGAPSAERYPYTIMDRNMMRDMLMKNSMSLNMDSTEQGTQFTVQRTENKIESLFLVRTLLLTELTVPTAVPLCAGQQSAFDEDKGLGQDDGGGTEGHQQGSVAE